tara:strand:- start:527 stop:1039 length:513 start_codon:yes stop_codon:yes gene_type:complete
MTDQIINKVAKSGLITLDLTDYAPKSEILEFDVINFLFEKNVLIEKEFRKQLKSYDFKKYHSKCVAVFCSNDSIVPMWAYMLITSYLKNFTQKIYFGSKESVFKILFIKNITNIDGSIYKNKKVIVKGCSGNIALTPDLYIEISKQLKPYVFSLMFGEACSAVPVYKNTK